MRKVAFLLCLLFLTVPAFAQHASANLTAHAAACGSPPVASAGYVSLPVNTNNGAAVIAVGGNGMGTISFFKSGDGATTWQALYSTDATPVDSTMSTGSWQFNVAGFTNICAAFTTYTSGTFVTTINLGQQSARIGGGSGGGVSGSVVSPNQATVYVATSCTGLGSNCIAAVADDSTNNATAFAAAAAIINAYTPNSPTDLPTLLFGAGTFRYASGLAFTQPMILQCENGGTLDYSGSAHAVDIGPTNLTGSTYQTTYIVQGCGFTGGASMTQGIYVNDGVLYPRIWDDRFLNFGNSTSTVWQVYVNGDSVGIDDPEVSRNFFFENDNTGRNGVKVNSAGVTGNQLRFTDNVMLCAQVPGTTNMNGTHSCSGGNTSAVGLYVDGISSFVHGNNIAWFPGGDVQLGVNSAATVVDNDSMETNSSSSSISTPAIVAGPASGAAPVSVSVDNVYVNVHNADYSTTSSAIGMGNASAVMVGWSLNNLTVYELSGSVVTLNNTSGNVGNTFGNIVNLSGSPIAAVFNSGSSIAPFVGLGSQSSGTVDSNYSFVCTASSSASNCFSGMHSNSSAAGTVSRFILDSGDDSESWPNRGGFLQHTSGSGGGTKIGDWEGLPVQVLTSPTAGNIQLSWQFNAAGSLQDETPIAVGSLPAAASFPGAIKVVNDSTSITLEGQTCVGSSGNTALAFSNGSAWKCF